MVVIFSDCMLRGLQTASPSRSDIYNPWIDYKKESASITVMNTLNVIHITHARVQVMQYYIYRMPLNHSLNT